MRQDELTRAKLEMVAARERGEDALLPLLKQRPTLAGELIDFSAALAATTAYADVELTPETETIAMQARDRLSQPSLELRRQRWQGSSVCLTQGAAPGA